MDGFSSEEELREIVLEEKNDPDIPHSHKEEVKFKISAPQEIQPKARSLHPDILTG